MTPSIAVARVLSVPAIGITEPSMATRKTTPAVILLTNNDPSLDSAISVGLLITPGARSVVLLPFGSNCWTEPSPLNKTTTFPSGSTRILVGVFGSSFLIKPLSSLGVE